MNVCVRIFSEQVRVSLQGIVNFHLRSVAVAFEGMEIPGGVAQGNVEIVNPVNDAGDFLARRQSYDNRTRALRSRAAPPQRSGQYPAALQRMGVVLAAN